MRSKFIFFVILSFLIFHNISFAGGYQSKSYGREGYLKKDPLDPDRASETAEHGDRRRIHGVGHVPHEWRRPLVRRSRGTLPLQAADAYLALAVAGEAPVAAVKTRR